MKLDVKTNARTELIDITSQINEKIRLNDFKEGMCLIFVPHTTAAVTINESADPDVKNDIQMVLDKLIPWKDGYRHLEGNSAAHVKTSLIGSSEIVGVQNRSLVLGTWQGIFFCEFDGPRNRHLHIHLI